MKTFKIKAEHYQFHYSDGKESGIRGLGKNAPNEIVVNLDNFIMSIDHTLYFRVTDHEYITILTDDGTIATVRNMTMYRSYKPKEQ